MAVCWTSIAQAVVTFDWATVGNPGNADDIHGVGYGSVDYTYRISKHEVTNAQYAEFLNAVDPTGANSLALYNPSMAANFGGIENTGTVDGARYAAQAGRAQNPVIYVSFFDAMRFVNWLHNGQGSGDTGSGVYTIGTGLNEVRSASAKYWVPSEDEWYKAAYHKNDGVTGNYFDYPTNSDTAPGYVNNSGNLSGTGNPFVEGGTDPGNYATYDGDGGTGGIGSPYYMTEVGEWENSASPYGTFDQGGNVWEWNEAVISSSFRGFRGSSWVYISSGLRADVRLGNRPRLEVNDLGFRVASKIPEPTTALLALAALCLAMGRRRKLRAR